MRNLIIILTLLVSSSLIAQKPKGVFIDSLLKIGKPVQFAFTFVHNNRSDVIFPDSTYNFEPFKLINIEYFPSLSKAGKSRDSVIYTLVTYEVDSSFSLSLPVIIGKSFKQKIYSDTEIIPRYISINQQDLQKKEIKSSTPFWLVKKDFNFPKLLYFLMVFLISAVVFVTLFRKTLLKQTKVYLFYRRNAQFMSDFKKYAKSYKNKANISKALVLWKTHLEKMTGKPFSSMTTKEIAETIQNERLNDALREFDATIYGGINSDHLPFAFNVLLDIATSSYQTQIKILKENLKKDN